MIDQKSSRAGWFGASDCKYIMGNWNTVTFINWWQIKLGIKDSLFKNIYTIAGTNIIQFHIIQRLYWIDK